MQKVNSILFSLEFFCQSIQLLTVEISSDGAAIWKKFPMDNPIDSSPYAQYHLLRMWISLRRWCTRLTSAQPLASVPAVNVQHPLFISSNKIGEPLLVALGCPYDKIIDLMVANSDDHTVSALLGNEDGTFQDQITYATGRYPQSVVSGDFNKDKKPDLIPKLVEKAAYGIIEEGKQIGKQKEAEEIANILLEKKHTDMEEVWRCCAYLFSLESFLYKTLNAAMRLVGSEGDEQISQSKVQTLGPFCLLLWDDPVNRKMKCNIKLYRGATLKPEQVERYQTMANKDEYGSFQGFSSCSRNRLKAEEFGNVLFIMNVWFAFVADLSEVSEYPDEEEELITSGVCFRVERVEFDRKKNKYLIYMELRQRFNGK